MYLVVLRYAMDDFPIRLVGDRGGGYLCRQRDWLGYP